MTNGEPTIRDLLRKRYADPEWIILFEVRNAAGFHATRTADAIAVNLWPSRGLEIHGIEIKAWRSDWIKEMKTPAKADEMFRFCDRWFLVAENEGVAKIPEIPTSWGFIERKGNKLMIRKEAPQLTPKPVTKDLLVTFLKASMRGKIDADSVDQLLRDATNAGKETQARDDGHRMEGLERLKKNVEEFEHASGLRIEHGWNHGKIGEAVKYVLNGGAKAINDDIRDLLERAKRSVAEITRIVEETKR